MARSNLLSDLAGALGANGLILRGGMALEAGDKMVGRSLVLVGNAGSAIWPHFSSAPEHHDGRDHALDRWTKRIMDALAQAFGAQALYPFGGPPYQPFQAWAKRCDQVWPSPLGLLIHPDFGLWHAYRAALVFQEELELDGPETQPSPCELCSDKPCLGACPVSAYSPEGYDVGACVSFIEKESPLAEKACLSYSCRARMACPVGQYYQYQPRHAAFHMAAFLRARQRAADATREEQE